MAMEKTPPPLLDPQDARLITRREAVQRVTALLGGMALVGGSALLTGCRDEGAAAESIEFSAEEVALLDEIAETILPQTSTPGAKAAGTGAFMALMVRDVYSLDDQRVFREGMRQLEEESRRMHDASFMQATPEQRLALLQHLDREQKAHMDSRARAQREAAGLPPLRTAPTPLQAADTAEADAYVPGQRQEGALAGPTSAVPAITADAPAHYFRMMKELALLGYFTSEIGYTQAMRYVESPGRFDPCASHAPGDRIWAPHA